MSRVSCDMPRAAEVVDRRIARAARHLLAFARASGLMSARIALDVGVADRRAPASCSSSASRTHVSAGELEQQSDLALVRALEHRRLGVEAEQLRGPPEVGLEDLSDVHSARHAERVEHDVDRPAVGQERHVLLGNDAGNDTLVAVASGHLVADRDLALLGQVDLHELDDARRQLIRLQDAVDALFRLLLELAPSRRWRRR